MSDALRDERMVVGWIAEITGDRERRVRDRLQAEYDDPGINVAAALRAAGLEKYIWTDELVRFYQETDSFLYELVLWNLNGLKIWMRRGVERFLARRGARSLSVLTVGDGLGFDSLQFVRDGHRVTYFELPGKSERFARRVFADAGVDVAIITDPDEIPKCTFDAVVCLDVLEHVPDPPEYVRTIGGYLRPGGVFVVNAPFGFIHPTTPTHLLSNRRYSGCASLFTRAGFSILDGEWGWNPIVLQYGGNGEPRGLRARAKTLGLRAAGCFLALGRMGLKGPLDLAYLVRRRQRRWFDDPV